MKKDRTIAERNSLATQCYEARNNWHFDMLFAQLAKIYQGELGKTMLKHQSSLNENDLKNIVQDTIIKAREVLSEKGNHKYKETGKFDARIKRALFNKTMDHFRYQEKYKTLSFDTPINGNNVGMHLEDVTENLEHSPEELIIQKELKEELSALIQHLSPEQQETVYLRHFAGLSFKEIAEEMNISINTALGRMRYALRHLRKLMDVPSPQKKAI